MNKYRKVFAELYYYLRVYCQYSVERWRIAPDGITESVVLGSQHGHVLVVRNPRCD